MPATNGVNVQTSGVNRHSGSALCTIDEFTSQAYDFVVGGGTARLVVAARLTENPNVKVGVIEAGENLMNDKNVSTPSLYPTLIGREKYDWCMASIPQPNAGNKTYSMPRGKLLPPQTIWLCKRRALHCQQNRSDPATNCRTGSGHASYTCLIHYPRNVPQLPYDYIPLALPPEHNRARDPVEYAEIDIVLADNSKLIQTAFSERNTGELLYDLGVRICFQKSNASACS